MRLPAICENCGRVFPSSFSANNSTMFMEGCKSGPCPFCGGIGLVPNGMYAVVDEMIKFVINENYTIKEMKDIKELFQVALRDNLTFEEIEEKAEKQNIEIGSILPKNREELRGDIKWFITILISILGLWNVFSPEENEELSELDAETVIQYIYENPDEFNVE
ncbi:hypothetical protein ACRCJ1_00110 [Aerococcus sp. L_4]